MARTNRSCDSLKLTLFHYGELSPEERSRLERHLEACPGCRSELETIRGTLHLLPDPAAPPAPREVQAFAARVLARRGRSDLGGESSPFGRGMAIAGALLLILLFYATPPREVLQDDALPSLTAADQIELLENLELLQNLDLLQALVEERS